MLENSHVRPFTYQDYLQIPDEPGFRYEVLEGMLVKDSAPSLLHQYVAQILFEIIKGYFTAVDPGGLAFLPLSMSPWAIQLLSSQTSSLFPVGKNKLFNTLE